METLSTKLTREEIEQFKQLCSEQASTPSQVLRHLIRQFLSNKATNN